MKKVMLSALLLSLPLLGYAQERFPSPGSGRHRLRRGGSRKERNTAYRATGR